MSKPTSQNTTHAPRGAPNKDRRAILEHEIISAMSNQKTNAIDKEDPYIDLEGPIGDLADLIHVAFNYASNFLGTGDGDIGGVISLMAVIEEKAQELQALYYKKSPLRVQ